MSGELHVVAIVTASPALTAILHAMMAANPRLRVRSFESATSLTAYMAIAPVDLIVCDFFLGAKTAADMVRDLRCLPYLARREFQVLAMTNTISPEVRRAIAAAGIDETLVKPMSPVFLEQRVMARLAETPAFVGDPQSYFGPERRGRLLSRPDRLAAPLPDNVISLFGARDRRRQAEGNA